MLNIKGLGLVGVWILAATLMLHADEKKEAKPGSEGHSTPPASHPNSAPNAGRGNVPQNNAGQGYRGPTTSTGRGNVVPNQSRPAQPTRSAGGYNAARPGNTPVRNGTVGARFANGRPQTVRTAAGHEASFRRDGSIRELHGNGQTITRGAYGERRFVAERGGRTFVANAAGHGYVQAGFNYGGRPFVERTYFARGAPYAVAYRPFLFRGVYLNVYAPYRYFAPGFYGWVYNPWRAPVVFAWGWGPSPWFGFYGGYFAPYPVYPAPAYWLTDYLIAAQLQAAYQERMDVMAAASGAPPPGSYPPPQQAYPPQQQPYPPQQQPYPQQPYPPQPQSYSQPAPDTGGQQAMLTPEVKQAIADEVRRQVSLANADAQTNAQAALPDPASSGLPRMLADGQPHAFVASSILQVDAGGRDCQITPGDVLKMSQPPPENSNVAQVSVLASKRGDCPKESYVSVNLSDLQEMQNSMRQVLDRGMGELQVQQGKNGMPAAPPAANQPPVKATFAAIAPPPDPNVVAELTQEATDGAKTERQLADEIRSTPVDGAQLAGNGAQPAAGPTVTLGMSRQDVISLLGNPDQVSNFGNTQVFTYANQRITLIGGKVSDIQ